MTLDDLKVLAPATPLKKLLFYIALPVILLFVLFGPGADMLGKALEQERRKRADSEDAKLEGQQAQAAAQSQAAEGAVAQLEKEKEDAQAKQAGDPAAFINDRYKKGE